MITKVRKFVEQYRLIDKSEGIVLGLSGGADSVCLFHMLLQLKEEYSIKLYAVHVNHRIRGKEADEDEAFVKELAAKNKIPCKFVHADVVELARKWKMTEEEAGRKVRYEAFEEEMKERGAKKIAVAHHANDQAETILFRMCRGSGIRGLVGMSPIRDNIIRPLLCLEKKEIYAYLKASGQSYVEDATNVCLDYDRNRIRELVIPQLEEINSKSVAHISSLSQKLSQITEWLDMECAGIYGQNVSEEDNSVKIKAGTLAAMHQVISSDIIRRMIEYLSNSMKDVEERHIDAVLKLACMESGKQLDLPYDIRAAKEYDYIVLEKKSEKICHEEEKTYNLLKSDMERGVSIEINNVYLPDSMQYADTLKLEINNTGKALVIEKNDYTKYIDCAIIKNSLSIRRPEKNDYFLFDGKNKKMLSRYMIDSKIPRKYRDKILVAADGNHVCMIIGGRTAKDCYVTASTCDTLIIKAFV